MTPCKDRRRNFTTAFQIWNHVFLPIAGFSGFLRLKKKQRFLSVVQHHDDFYSRHSPHDFAEIISPMQETYLYREKSIPPCVARIASIAT